VQDVVDVLEGLFEHVLSVLWVTAYPASTAGMVPPNAEG